MKPVRIIFTIVRLWFLLLLVEFISALQMPSQAAPADHIYQFSVKVGERVAYLWIPPSCKHLRGVVVALNNMLERQWLEDPLIRQTATETDLGIIWIGPPEGKPILTADMKSGAATLFDMMLDEFAKQSGYSELKNAFVIPMGHSANGQFGWTFAAAFPERTIACIPIKTVPLPDSLPFKGIPLCYVVGETTEWPQYRVPDPATRPGDRDFFWPVVRNSAVRLRSLDQNNLISVVTDPGGGHFDWSPHISRFVSLFIKKACFYRLPDKLGQPLKPVKLNHGWLIDASGMEPDKFVPALYNRYTGNINDAYWLFDKETAFAATTFAGDRLKRKKQMITFVQDGKLLNVGRLGYAALKFKPDSDGITIHLKGDFLSEVPNELIGAGAPLYHAPGPISFRMITGPAIQIGPADFKVEFSRGNKGGDIWIQEEHPGNVEFRHAVQPGKISIPVRITQGLDQQINFGQISDVSPKIKQIRLIASASSGLPVRFYIESGPATVSNDTLILQKIPVRCKRRVAVTVTAYQWGRLSSPAIKSADMITRTFYINP